MGFETAGANRVGGLTTWEGFVGQEQIVRQRRVWQMLRQELTPKEQLQIGAVLTLTPEELLSARQG